MKLVTFAGESGARAGVVLDGDVVDLQKLMAFHRASGGKGDAWEWAQKRFPVRMVDLMAVWEESRPWAEEGAALYAQARAASGGALSRCGQALSATRLLAPIPQPGKFVCLGRNYREHVSEGGKALPPEPIIFGQFPSAIIGPGAPIVIWPTAENTDYEAELAIVIGREGRFIPRERALDYVAGYMNYNDVTSRKVQQLDGQWTRGKNFDTYAPCGPYLVTADEVGDANHLRIRLELNGEVMQDSNTGQMHLQVPEIVSSLSQVMTLEPGDLIGTGSPAGIGLYRKPQRFLRPGDWMMQEIEKLGRLENPVIAAEGVEAYRK